MTDQDKAIYREQKKEKIKNLIQQIAEMSEEEKQRLSELAIINPEGHILSGRNQQLLYLQSQIKETACPTVVGGFRQWQKHERSVSKGQSGYIILVPSQKKEDSTNKNQDEENPELFFLAKYVFDISQTQELNKLVVTEGEAVTA